MEGREHTTLIGLDAASQRDKFGFAIATYRAPLVQIEEAGCLAQGKPKGDQLSRIASVIGAGLEYGRVLIAIDAPLGWPRSLGQVVDSHRAGEATGMGKNEMFGRRTDQLVKAQGKPHPLEVGADKIARATHEALTVLSLLRQESGLALPLVWSAGFNGAGVIEVYPAASLRAHGLAFTGYKKPEHKSVREAIAARLEPRMPALIDHCAGDSNAFDACLCLLAAADFIEGTSVGPPAEHEDEARKEGWIWLPTPDEAHRTGKSRRR